MRGSIVVGKFASKSIYKSPETIMSQSLEETGCREDFLLIVAIGPIEWYTRLFESLEIPDNES